MHAISACSMQHACSSQSELITRVIQASVFCLSHMRLVINHLIDTESKGCQQLWWSLRFLRISTVLITANGTCHQQMTRSLCKLQGDQFCNHPDITYLRELSNGRANLLHHGWPESWSLMIHRFTDCSGYFSMVSSADETNKAEFLEVYNVTFYWEKLRWKPTK